ncbi:hypothetical protein MtrunA17_Chr5g0425891 [Medicago truncatula]|uniref:Uncharacterized protein n=1 Tax=Medicago truncatula TaxID=3880 RepID=A0A396HVX5_MEDTR|nr:hypothetical protein MtrunA17_Chr5g0425891 [Medicago truncatula]
MGYYAHIPILIRFLFHLEYTKVTKITQHKVNEVPPVYYDIFFYRKAPNSYVWTPLFTSKHRELIGFFGGVQGSNPYLVYIMHCFYQLNSSRERSSLVLLNSSNFNLETSI